MVDGKAGRTPANKSRKIDKINDSFKNHHNTKTIEWNIVEDEYFHKVSLVSPQLIEFWIFLKSLQNTFEEIIGKNLIWIYVRWCY